VRGDLGRRDQDTIMGSGSPFAVSQLAPRRAWSGAAGVHAGRRHHLLLPQRRRGPAIFAEGCDQQAGPPVAGARDVAPDAACQSGNMGYTFNYGAGVPGEFDSARWRRP